MRLFEKLTVIYQTIQDGLGLKITSETSRSFVRSEEQSNGIIQGLRIKLVYVGLIMLAAFLSFPLITSRVLLCIDKTRLACCL